jgi:polysaccharide biosynthesis/export protein
VMMARIPILVLTLMCLGLCSLERTAAQQQPQLAVAETGHGNTPKSGKADAVDGPVLSGDRHPLYRLHHSDIVSLSFAFAPEYNQELTVQPDGYVSLKELPEMYVEGMTLLQFQETTQRAYGSFLNHPKITASLKEFEKPYFIATGQVTHPGKYELQDDMTVTEALAVAGGFTERAKHSQVVLFRRVSNDVSEARVLNIKDMLKTRDLKEDMRLRSGDLLYVPQNTISKLQRFFPASSLGMYLNSNQF